ncbi:MAG: tRNA preQ1(34) S-adenosylmethionine ribosyltransferase-isomerase QueA [Rhodospirillales bacterium]|nr:tRNA preQ1(34) S-adenosylmethionine ribosyltransferase-isomerase QueA [Rhodospirillales bacterium]
MRVDLFDFELPEALIAQRPARPRDSARLLRLPAAGDATAHTVRDLPDLVDARDLLVFNDTRVLPARLYGARGGARIEALLLRALDERRWTAMARPAGRLRPGERLDFEGGIAATVAARRGDGTLELEFDLPRAALAEALRAHGHMPLPPYIRGGRDDAADRDDYQTALAARDGAIAAPTAALHFTSGLLERLRAKGCGIATVTLHVGAGTFQPVRVEDTRDHAKHEEWGEVGAAAVDAIAACRARGGRVVAVGTTTLRLLETVAARNEGRLTPWTGDTGIFITPGYRFAVVDRLMTNFHLPRSTLFMLVAAFAGLDRMRALYARAIADGYRFYSYGDCCLLDRAGSAETAP